jgi:hypothetical protein
MKVVFARCFKKMAIQVCTVLVIIMCFCLYNTVCLPSIPYNYLYPESCFTLLITVILQIKINHDSHEFILESCTIVNSSTSNTAPYFLNVSSEEERV